MGPAQVLSYLTEFKNSPAGGYREQGTRRAPCSLHLGSHLDRPEFAPPAGANSQAARSAAVGLKSLLRYQAQHALARACLCLFRSTEQSG
jgi:hypothetical protein